ncbi:MAG: DNA polymerase III subunit gamma/tau [Planctomycetaceae bacterium]|nr:DNA polymerase III subunit gamma/tau [Planctomycetaceae bacterium]
MVTGSTGSYTVLARRFRPQGFADVVGQEHVAQALRNAILANRVAHAYLFTGARGVGKTSTARILAKALNCPESADGNPCNECEICDGIAAGNDVDVLEIDGASNRGIDDIRQLRANVNVKSMRTQYKLYIIDEVHMLTKEAFNALLKTLEEPPPNVKFVFCTTEPQKIPDTILSRCQRFDFGTIETSNIKALLARIAVAEGVEVDDDALELVARRAAGSMRDSQSIFDQLLAFGEEQISALDVHRLLGTASDDRLIDIGQALVERDKAKAIDSFHAALDGGVQLGELTDQLLFYLRDLMIMASEATSVGLLSVAPVSRKLLQKQAETWGLQTIVAAMQILSDTKGRMQRVTYGRALAELALVRIAMLEDLTSISGLIDKLRSGEPISAIQPVASPPAAEKKNDVAGSANEVETADVVVEIPTASVEQSLAPVETPIAAVSEKMVSDASLDEGTAVERKELPVRIVSASSMAADSVGDVPEGMSETEENSEASSGEAAGELTDSTSGGGLAEVATTLVDSRTNAASEMDEATSSTTALDEAPVVVEAMPQVADGPENDSADASGAGPEIWFTPENSQEIWAIVVLEINDMLKSHVKSVSSTAISAPNKLELTLPPKYHFGKTYLEKPEAQSRLQKIIARLTGVEPRITVVLGEIEADDQKAETSSSQNGGRQLQRVFKPEADELVCSVVEIFDAQVVRINEISGGAGDK